MSLAFILQFLVFLALMNPSYNNILKISLIFLIKNIYNKLHIVYLRIIIDY